MSLRNKSLSALDREIVNLRESADHDERYAAGLESDVARFMAMAERNAATDPMWSERCRQDALHTRRNIARKRAEANDKRAEAMRLLVANGRRLCDHLAAVEAATHKTAVAA